MKRSDYLRSITVQKNGSTFYTRSKMKPGFQIVAGDPRPTGERARAACRDDYDLGHASAPGFILGWVYLRLKPCVLCLLLESGSIKTFDSLGIKKPTQRMPVLGYKRGVD